MKMTTMKMRTLKEIANDLGVAIFWPDYELRIGEEYEVENSEDDDMFIYPPPGIVLYSLRDDVRLRARTGKAIIKRLSKRRYFLIIS